MPTDPIQPNKPNIDLNPYKYTPEIKQPKPQDPLGDLQSSKQYGEAADFGNSKYDESNVSGLDLQTGDYKYERGEKQSGLGQLGLGVLRAAEKATIEGLKTPGYLYALGEWGVKGLSGQKDENGEDFTLDKALDNQYLNALESADEFTKEKLLPVYQSYKAGKGSFIDQVLTTSFIAREGADGIGYLAGMMLPGYAIKSVGMAAKLSKAGLNISKLGKYGDGFVKGAGKIGLTGANIELGTQTLINTSVEALAEAKGAVENLQNKGITDPEVLANAAREVFKDNMGILLLPNLIMNKALLGGGKKSSNLLDDFRDASGKLTVTPKGVSSLKDAGKAFGKGVVAEGFIEEGGQTTIENYETKKALHQTDKGFIEGIASEYLDMLGTTEGKKSILLGALIGGIANTVGSLKESKFKKSEYPNISKLIAMNPEGFSDNVDIYKRDENDDIIYDDNNQPVKDDKKIIDNIKNLINETRSANEADKAALNNDKTVYDYVNHNSFTRSILPYIQYGEVGMEILNEKLDGIKQGQDDIANSKEIPSQEDKVNTIKYITDLKSKAKQLQGIYNDTQEVIDNLNLESIKIPEEYKDEIDNYKNSLTNAVFQENAKQIFLKEKLRELDGEYVKYKLNDIPQNRLFADKIKVEMDGIFNMLQDSFKQYEALKDSEEHKSAIKQYVDDKNKEAEILQQEAEKQAKKEAKAAKEAPKEAELNNEKVEHAQMMYAALNSGNIESFDPVYENLIKSPLLSKSEKQQLEDERRKHLTAKFDPTNQANINLDELTTDEVSQPPLDESDDVQSDVSKFLNSNTDATTKEENQTTVTPDNVEYIEATTSEKHIASRNNIVMMRLFDHFITKVGLKKYFSFKRNADGFPQIDNNSGIDINELNKLKEGNTVELKLVDKPELDETYQNMPDYDGHHIGIYSNDKLIGFVQQPHTVDPESKNYDESKAVRDELIQYRKDVVFKLRDGQTITEKITSKGNGNLYTKLNDKGFIDPITNVLYDARPKDLLNGNVVFAYVSKTKTGKAFLDIKQGDLTNAQFAGLKKALDSYSDKLQLNPGQPFQMVKAPNGEWSIIPVYANKIDTFTANLILDILSTTENNADLMDLSKKLDDFIFTSIKNDRANLFIKDDNGKLIFKVNTHLYSLDDIKTNKKTKEAFIDDLNTQRQNINVTNINSTAYQAQLKARNTLITNVTQYEGEYFVQPYIEYTHEANTENKPQAEVITEQLTFDANQNNTDVNVKIVDIERRRTEDLKNIESLRLQDLKTWVANKANSIEETKKQILEDINNDETFTDLQKDILKIQVEELFVVNGNRNPFIMDDIKGVYKEYKGTSVESWLKYHFPNLTKEEYFKILPVEELDNIFLEHKIAILGNEEGESGLPENTFEVSKDKINAKYDAELVSLKQDNTKTESQNLVEKALSANNIDINQLNDDEALSRTLDTTKLDSKAFKAWLSKNLPQLSVGDKSNLEQLKLNLTDTFGMFKGMTIYLFDGAGSKTAFHEAFHGVFRNFLSLDEKHAIINEAKTKYTQPTEDELKSLQEGLSRTYTNEQLTYLYYEEKLADEFAEFTYNYNNKTFLQKLGRTINDFFNKILSLFNLFTLNNSAVETVFTNINKAKYSKSKSSKVEGVSIVNRPLEVFNDEVAYSKALRDKFNPATEQRIIQTIGNKFIAIYQQKVSTGSLETGKTKIYDEIFKYFNDFLVDSIDNPGKYSATDIKNAVTVFDEKNRKLIKNEVNRYLRGRNINVEDDTIVYDETQLSETELGDEEIVAQDGFIDKGFGDATSVSGVTSASTRLKMFLSSIPIMEKDNEVKKDVYGIEQYYDFNKTYYHIERNLTGVYTLEEQVLLLHLISETRPELKAVITKLGYEVIPNPNDEFEFLVNELPIANINTEQLELLRNDFKTNFSKQQLAYTLIKFTTDKKTGGISYEVMDSNRQTIAREINDTWTSNIVDPNRDTIAEWIGEEYTPFGSTKAKALLTEWNAIKSKKLTAKELNDIFNKAGIEYSKPTLELLAKDELPYKLQFTSYLEWFQNDKSSVLEEQGKKALRELVELETKTVLNNYTSSFNDVENKNIYSIQLPSFISKTLSIINSEGNTKFKTWLNDYQRDSLYKYSNLLSDLKENSDFRRNDFKVSFLDGLKKSKGDTKGSKFTNMNPRDFMSMQFALFQNKTANARQKGLTMFKHMYITPSDKSMGAIFDMKKYQVAFGFKEEGGSVKGEIKNSEITKAFYNVVLGEASRIKHNLDIKAKVLTGEIKLDTLSQYYHFSKTNWNNLQPYIIKQNSGLLTESDYKDVEELFDGQAFRFNNFTGAFNSKILSKVLDVLNTTTIDNIEEAFESTIKEDILKEINEELTKEFRNTLNEMLDKGLIKVNKGVYSSVTLDVNKALENKDIIQLVADFSANTLLANTELSLLFNGDPAQYKPGDMQKRTYQSQSMITNNRFSQKTIKTLVVKDVMYESETIDSLVDTLESLGFSEKDIKSFDLNKYKDDLNVTDAQVYITPELYKKIHVSRGTWNDKMQKAFDIVEGKETGKLDESLRMLLGAIKPFYYGNRFDETLGIQRYEQVKCAMIPMFKAYTDINPLLKQKLAEMKDSGAEMLAHESSFKAAIGYRGAIENNNTNTIELDTDNFGIQVDNPIHGMDEKNDSMRQLKMLLLGSVDAGKTYKGISGKTIIDDIMAMESANLVESLKDLNAKMDTKKNTNFSNFVKDMVTKRNATNNVEELLNIINGEFEYPLDNGTLSTQIEQLISSMYTNNVIKQPFAGDARVQATSLGLKFKNLAEQQENLPEDAKLLQQELQWFKPTEDGIEYAECAMPAWSKHFFNEQGFLKDINDIPDALKQIIAYRIPTEGLHSMMPIKVVKFLPETMGNFILLPYEVTVQMGADFDFDKIYFINKEMYNDINNDGTTSLKEYSYNSEDTYEAEDTRYARYLRYTFDNKLEQMDRDDFSKLDIEYQNTRAARNNKIIDNYMTLLTAKENLHLLIKPSGFDKMKGIKKLYDYEGNVKDNFFSSRVQRDYKDRNHTGIALKGQSALHVSGHSYAVLTDLNIKTSNKLFGIKFNGQNKTKFNGLYTEDDTLIADELSSIMAAILDDIKEPILEKLGINKNTIDVLATIIRSGYNMETALRFVSQPAIKELSRLLDANTAKLKDVNQKKYNVKNLIEEYLEKLYAFKVIEMSEEVNENIKESAKPSPNITDKEMDYVLSKYKVKGDNIKFTETDENGNNRSLPATPEQLANYYALQIKMLKSFSNLNSIARELTELNKFFAINKEVGPNYEDIISKQELYDSIMKSDVLEGFSLDMIPTLQETWRVHQNALEFFSKYFPYGSKFYMDTKRTLFAIQTGKPLNQAPVEARQYLNNFIRTYIDNNGGYFSQTYEQYEKLLVSLPKQITDILKGNPETKLGNVTYQQVRDNFFMSNIMVKFDPKNPTTQYIKIKGNKLDTQVKNSIIEGFSALYANSNTKQLAIDMIDHSFATSGFSSSIGNIAPYISPNILKELGYTDYRKNAIEILNKGEVSLSTPYILRLIDQAVRNNGNTFTKIYDNSMFSIAENSPIPNQIQTNLELINNSGRADEFILNEETNLTPEYIRLFDTNGELYFERSDLSTKDNIIYNKINPLGKKNYLIEVNPLEDIKDSFLKENNKAIKVDETLNEGLDEENISDEFPLPILESNTQILLTDGTIEDTKDKTDEDKNKTFEDDPNPCK